MLSVLKNRAYAKLFAAQGIALLGTGLLTIALGLLAFQLAGERAGAVLGTAYAIKMIAYVGLAPIASALVARLPRKAVLITADLARAGTALFLPFITEVWQIYALIFVLQAASATFTPAFQATIPDILPEEKDYTRALSLSRLLYDMENLISPALAGFLLTIMSFSWLFGGTVIGFVASAALVAMTRLPGTTSDTVPRPFRERLTRGARIYLATPRLRGVLALTLTAAAASGFVIVNTVVMVRANYGLDDRAVAAALAAFGAGSMIAALSLPRLLENRSERGLMLAAGLATTALMLGIGGYMQTRGLPGWPVFLGLWATTGLLFSTIITPVGRLLRQSAQPEDRPAIFAAHFALSHACWLITYPVAGFVGQGFGLGAAMLALGGIALVGVALAWRLWPAGDTLPLAHTHSDLPADHPHFQAHQARGNQHAHAFIIDDQHPVWPTRS